MFYLLPVELLKFASVRASLPRVAASLRRPLHYQTLVCSADAARPMRMEVECDTLTERQEGGGSALLQVHASDGGSSADSPMQIDDGQLGGRVRDTA